MNREDLVYIVKKVRREVEKRNRNMLDGNIGNNTLDEYLEKSGSYIHGLCIGVSYMCDDMKISEYIENKFYSKMVDELLETYDICKLLEENN